MLSKLCRADALDLEDIAYVVRRERLRSDDLMMAVASAQVPEVFSDVLPESTRKLEALLRELGA